MKQKPEPIHEAKCLLQDLSKKETAVMSVFWAVILKRFDAVSKSLQKKTIELQTTVNMLKSLSDFLTSQRDLFDEYKEKANEKVKAQYSDDCNRLCKRKRHHADGDAEEVVGYFLENTSLGLKPIYQYWTDYLLSSTAACKHTSKFSHCLDF